MTFTLWQLIVGILAGSVATFAALLAIGRRVTRKQRTEEAWLRLHRRGTIAVRNIPSPSGIAEPQTDAWIATANGTVIAPDGFDPWSQRHLH